MDSLEERNLVWNLVELIILKNGLKITSELLDPTAEDEIIFGNFVSGHPMSFEGDFKDMTIEVSRKLPSGYQIVQNYTLDTGSGVIGIMKMKQ